MATEIENLQAQIDDITIEIPEYSKVGIVGRSGSGKSTLMSIIMGTTLPESGSVSIGNDIVDVKALDGYFPTHYKFVNNLSEGLQRSYWKGSTQTSGSTPDGLDPVETFTTNPNILRVAKTGRGSGEPILEVD